MAGYYKSSMSNNAVEAYQNGDQPLSKWTKSEILDNIQDESKKKLLSKLTKEELQFYFLKWTSWHHTSKLFNKTRFFSVDFDEVEKVTEEIVNNIIKQREPRTRKEQEPAPLYVSAWVEFSEWEGTRKHPQKVNYSDFVTFRSNDKIIYCPKIRHSKRLSSVFIKYKIEQKTKYATAEKLAKKFNIKELLNNEK